jgi:hypothetical protein
MLNTLTRSSGGRAYDRLWFYLLAHESDVIDNGMLDAVAFVPLLVGLEQEFGVTLDVAALQLGDFRSIPDRAVRGSQAGRSVPAMNRSTRIVSANIGRKTRVNHHERVEQG